MRIARRFNAGLGVNKKQVPKGRPKRCSPQPFLPDSVLLLRIPGVETLATIEESLRDSPRRSNADLRPRSSKQVRLEVFPRPATLRPCRSTNFIVTNANGTAKSSCAPPTGRELNARTAARRSCRRNCLYSRPVLPGTPRNLRAPANRVRAVCAARANRIRTEVLGWRAEEVWIQPDRTGLLTSELRKPRLGIGNEQGTT